MVNLDTIDAGTLEAHMHAQAVALAAAVLGVSARIVMSPSAPPEKIIATQTAGAEVVFAPDSSWRASNSRRS